MPPDGLPAPKWNKPRALLVLTGAGRRSPHPLRADRGVACKALRRIEMRLNALCRLSSPRHPITATEDQGHEQASQHRSDYCCARVCRACFGTAGGSGPDCEHRHRAGCYPSRGYGPSSPLFNLNLKEESAGLPAAAPSWKVQELAAPVPPGTEPPQPLRQ